MSDEVNIPLLRKGVEWVEAQDKLKTSERSWYQGSWVIPEDSRVDSYGHAPGCGTAYCLAGYIGQLVDERFETSDRIEDEDGEDVHVSVVAEKALGLSAEQADMLFKAYNSAADIREFAEMFAGEKL